MDSLTKSGPLAVLIKLWEQLTPAQRVVVTAFAALSVALVIFIASAATKPRMAVLFSGLASEDAGAIVQKLSEQKVPYVISADGSTVEVPENKVYDMRLQLATQGLPQGGSVGFEIFDKSSFGMTEFAEKLNYQRAIAGELQRTIGQLAPVMSARVHIAIPETQVYESDQEPATASVVLKLRRGMPLGDEQIGGIVHLVSSAVQGMKANNVTVIDSEGNVLSEGPTTSGGGLMSSNQTKLKKQYESELGQSLQSMLAKTLGADKAVVRVSADLSFDQKQMKSESYEPAQASTGEPRGVLVTEQKTTEAYNGSSVPSGVAGGRAGGGPSDKYDRSESTAQYGVTKRIEETVSAPGQVSRLSVAVLLDEKVEITKLEAIRQTVAAAAGIDEKRGDQVTVQRIAFDTKAAKAAEAEAAGMAKRDMFTSIGKNVGGVVLLLVFLFFLKGMLKGIK